MEKLRYKISMKRVMAKKKIPFRVLSSEPYKPKKVEDYQLSSGAKVSGHYGPLGIDGFSKFVYPDGITLIYNLYTI